jgi:hypothetical protein
MPLFKKQSRITKSEQLAFKPVRLVEVQTRPRPDGGIDLTAPLQPARWAAWLVRTPSGTTKTFELDEMGKMVWDNIDGKTNVQQIIRRLAKRYNCNLREAEVSTLTFLNTLIKKGLVGMATAAGKKKES